VFGELLGLADEGDHDRRSGGTITVAR